MSKQRRVSQDQREFRQKLPLSSKRRALAGGKKNKKKTYKWVTAGLVGRGLTALSSDIVEVDDLVI